MSFCETQPSLKKNHPKLARQEFSSMPTTQHTSTRQRKNTEKETETLLCRAGTLSYTLIKGGFMVPAIQKGDLKCSNFQILKAQQPQT